MKKLIVVSAPHPNLYWDDLPKNSLLNEAWHQFIQSPAIPENEFDSTINFIPKFFPHLEKPGYSEFTDEQGNAITNIDLLDCYKYIFSRKKDWTGPLNYYRNFYFYRIKAELKVECPCLVVFGNDENFHRIETLIKSSDYCEQPVIKVIEGGNHFPHQQSAVEFNKILINYLIGELKSSLLYDL